MRRIVMVCVLFGLPGGLPAQEKAEPKSAKDWLAQAREQFDRKDYKAALTALNECLQLEPKNSAALDVRGSTHFMLAKFAESVRDFDTYLDLQPKRANEHWRRGISLYYAGRFEDGKKQFEGYQKFQDNDVENGVWHFLCAAKKDGVAKARQNMLEIRKDGRVPMMEVYDLFRGKCEPADVLKAAEAGKLEEKARRSQLFYAHLYLGLFYDATGDTKKAAEHMALAANKYRIGHYMGEVARVHHELLQKAKK